MTRTLFVARRWDDHRQRGTPALSLRRLTCRIMMGLLVGGAAAACGSGGPTDAVSPRLAILSGDAIADTAFAVLGPPLAVEVLGSDGRPTAGMSVQFKGTQSTAVAEAGATTFQNTISIATDAGGVARARVQLGAIAGPGLVSISVSALGLAAAAHYTVEPGVPVHVVVAPHDSALYVGASYALRSSVTDRNGNRRADALSYSTSAGVVRASGAGLLTGDSIGRAFVITRDGPLVDTAWVSIVPFGSLAVWANTNSEPSSVATINLDGSAYRHITTSVIKIYPMEPHWLPDGSHMVFQDVHGSALFDTLRLYVVDLVGNVSRLAQTYNGYVPLAESNGQPSRDGRYVYFTGAGLNDAGMWRVRVDSQTAHEIGPALNDAYQDALPSPSPDGTRVAYQTNRDCGSCDHLRILHVDTDAIDSLDVPGQGPHWSPTSEQIAFLGPAASLAVMTSDGSGQRAVGLAGRGYTTEMDWSPDGTWIAIRSDGNDCLDLVNVASGLTLPLAFTQGLHDPSWHP